MPSILLLTPVSLLVRCLAVYEARNGGVASDRTQATRRRILPPSPAGNPATCAAHDHNVGVRPIPDDEVNHPKSRQQRIVEAVAAEGADVMPERRREIRNQVDAQLRREQAQQARRWIVRDLIQSPARPNSLSRRLHYQRWSQRDRLRNALLPLQ